MKISILCSNLSSNALGRAYLLGCVLQSHYEVEILGPAFGNGIWPPCDDGTFTYKPVKGCHFPCFFNSMQHLVDNITGDVIYAVKPRPSSFGVALLCKKRRGTPVLLDIDDWDYAGGYGMGRIRRLLSLLLRFYHPYANKYLLLMELLVSRADAVTTVSTMLQKRFGGSIIPHGRDTLYLDPAKYDGQAFRREYKLLNRKIVMFFGTPRPHKGLEELVTAVTQYCDPSVVLVVVGVDPHDSYTQHLQLNQHDNVITVGMQPFAKIPYFLSAADVVALPQRDIPFARAQVPAKVFDAMAMAKPIIATDVGDLPVILQGCGIIVPPEDTKALGEAFHKVLNDPDLALALGSQARQRCIKYYSWSTMSADLIPIIESIKR